MSYDKSHKSSLAIDYEKFNVKPRERRETAQQKAGIQLAKIHGWAKRTGKVSYVIIAAAVVFMTIAPGLTAWSKGSMLDITENELNAKIAAVQKTNAEYRSELTAKATFSKVEEYAQNVLGLTKVNPSQVNHIRIKSSHMTEIAKEERTGLFDRICDWVDRFFGG